ncbi:uncharacterized protein ARMOST_18372 [Armillaria ostoyae]|uniref:Uncharacterized protein n=1 Tax=Armillaria ostoyae TaxID=47428 RepID=A0A284S1P1_ARMOS|nr:uncharacterized protein ARMOST_18372 [Armillaria ostoyae]
MPEDSGEVSGEALVIGGAGESSKSEANKEILSPESTLHEGSQNKADKYVNATLKLETKARPSDAMGVDEAKPEAPKTGPAKVNSGSGDSGFILLRASDPPHPCTLPYLTWTFSPAIYRILVRTMGKACCSGEMERSGESTFQSMSRAPSSFPTLPPILSKEKTGL